MSGGCLVILYEASASFSSKLSKIGCLLLTLEQTNVISNLMLFRLKRVVQAPLPTMYNSNCVKRQTQSPMQRWRSLHHIIKRKIGVVLIVFGLCCLFFGSSTNVTPLKPVSTSVYSGFLFQINGSPKRSCALLLLCLPLSTTPSLLQLHDLPLLLFLPARWVRDL